MSEKIDKKLICIVCPVGCRLEITGTTDTLEIAGNQCKRGPVYAKDEITNPTRMVCTTVKIENGIHSVIPVKTDKPIQEKYKIEIMELINKAKVISPVKVGDVIISNILGTDVNIVATRNM